jgi:hypothetical protein
MPEVVIGKDTVTNTLITIGDLERRSGLYILGKSGMGKSVEAVSIMQQDIEHGHGLFVLDPHGTTVNLLLHCCTHPRLETDLVLINVQDDTYSVGINPLACDDVASWSQRNEAYDRVRWVFFKLFETEFGDKPWLEMIIVQTLHVFIEAQDYTLADIPLFLTDPAFRAHVLRSVQYKPDVVDFWTRHFQQQYAESLYTRMLTMLSHDMVNHLVGQRQTTLDFATVMAERKIVLVKISADTAPDRKKFIGTVLINELLHAIRKREALPEDQRHQFCIFIDEFQHFVHYEDFAVLLTEARKYGIAVTFIHVERYGQLGDNKQLIGATDAVVNKMFFQLSVRDAEEEAPEVAKDSPTETRRERKLVISENPVADLQRGHANPIIGRFVREYLRSLTERLEDTQAAMEVERIKRLYFLDAAGIHRLFAQRLKDDPYYNAYYKDTIFGVLQRAASTVQQAQDHTLKLLQLHQSAQSLRQVLRALDRFLTAVMEGQIAQGQEPFARFLLDLLAAFFPISPTLELYIGLAYGDPTRSRSIPFTLARRYGPYRQEAAQLALQAEERTRRERQAYQRARNAELEARLAADGRERREQVNKQRAIARERVELRIFRFEGGFRKPPYWGREDYYHTFVWLECCPRLRDIVTPISSRFSPLPFEEVLTVPSIPEYLKLHRRDTVQKFYSYLRTCRGLDVIAVLLRLAEQPFYGWGRRQLDSYPYLCMLDFPHIPRSDPLELLRIIAQINEVKHSVRRNANEFRDRYITHFGPNSSKPAESSFFDHFRRKPDTPDRDANVSKPPSADEYIFRQSLADCSISDLIKRLEKREFINVDRSPTGEFRNAFTLRTELQRGWEPFARQYPGAARVLSQCDELARTYLLARAYDLVFFGQEVANVTFPEPRMTGIQETMAALMREVEEIVVERPMQKREKEQTEWNQRLRRPDETQALARISYAPPEMLVARIPSISEREELKNACRAELSGSRALQVITDFVQFCDLLREPENLVQVPSTQYIETQVNTYTTQEMNNQMVKELIKLPLRTCYGKLVQEQAGSRVVSIFKLQTIDVLVPQDRQLPEINNLARRTAVKTGILRKRSDIEDEIRARRERWRRGAASEESPRSKASIAVPDEPPPAEEPPPTKARDSKPPEPEERPRKRPKNTALKPAKRPQAPRKRGR